MGKSRRTRVLVAALPLLMVACTGGDDADTNDIIGVADDDTERCLDFELTDDSNIDDLPEVACSTEHSHELVGVVDSPADAYPGFDALEEFAQAACLTEFENFVGISAFDSALFYTWIVPSIDSWNSDEKDRQVLCLAGSADGRDLVGSVRDTRL